VGLEFARKRLDRAIGRAAPPKLVDCRTQQSVEPRHNAFVRRRLVGPIHHLGECVLENVLSQLLVADAPLDVSEESAVVL